MDKDLVLALAKVQMMMYVGVVCPHCKVAIVEEDLKTLVWSNHKCPTHGTCFYVNEADDEWKKDYSEFAPKGDL